MTYLEHLEERSLSGITPSRAGGHFHVDGGNGTYTGGCRHTVLLDHVTDFAEVAVGEDESHVPDHLGEKLGRDNIDSGQRKKEEVSNPADEVEFEPTSVLFSRTRGC